MTEPSVPRGRETPAAKPIVVGTDGSAQAQRAVTWAAREAVLRGARLRIVSAAEMLPRMTMPAQPADIATVATVLVQERDRALAAAVTAAAAAAPDLPVEVVSLGGPPAPAVADSGAGALLLVVGTHGSGAFAAMTLGSVSRYVAVHAACPVVVVREPLAGQRLVVVGIRSTEDCGDALTFAFEEARLRRAALLAVHAGQFQTPDITDMRADTELDRLLDDWRGKYPDVDVRHDAARGHPARVLADLSATADLVVLGRHGGSGRRGPGPARVIHGVISHAQGPVAIVPLQAPDH